MRSDRFGVGGGAHMVDLKKLIGQRRVVDVTDPVKLFDSLDRQATHTTLRPAQTQALAALGARRQERDLVLKMSTGAGKTATALLFMWSHTQEKNQPGVFLCATTQLVEQVVAEAERLGIKADAYLSGQPHPEPKGMSGRSLIVCTYEKLFNARTTFDRSDVGLTPCILAMDDAHAGIDRIRDGFTVRMSAKDKLQQKLVQMFAPALKKHAPGPWSGIENGDAAAMVEVPYWHWRPLAARVREMLAKAESDDHDSLIFVWRLIRDHLEWCRCIISGTGLEIVPDILPIDSVRAFREASHRLFMSATLADDSALVRELNCDAKAALNPIIPPADSGIGERMVLAPSLFYREFGRRWVMDWCRLLAKRYRVVVLSPSERAAVEWKPIGATVVTGDDVSDAVNGLRTGSISFAAFAQRYDGIDLPDAACRVLVIDGMPHGQGIAAAYDTDPSGAPGGSQNRLIHRIEQGMGRAVRSQADFAVVFLAGPELANYIAKTDVLDRMNAGTRAQLMLTQELADESVAEGRDDATAAAALHDLLSKCLQRDESWKDLYEDRVRRVAAAARHEVNSAAITIAQAERQAFTEAISGHPARASEILQNTIAEHVRDIRQKGWLLQRVAGYQWDYDQAKAVETQNAAYQNNSRMFVPPKGAQIRPRDPERSAPQVIVDRWYRTFSNPNGAVAAVEALRSRLSFGNNYRDFEQALYELGELVGAEALRPEYDYQMGPDCVWFWPDISFVMEAKNEAQYARIPKKDTAQLHDSVQWFKNTYPAREGDLVPMMLAPVSSADKQANFPDGTRIMTPSKLSELIDGLASFVAALANKLPDQWSLKDIAQLQLQHKLTPKQIIGAYTLPLQKAEI